MPWTLSTEDVQRDGYWRKFGKSRSKGKGRNCFWWGDGKKVSHSWSWDKVPGKSRVALLFAAVAVNYQLLLLSPLFVEEYLQQEKSNKGKWKHGKISKWLIRCSLAVNQNYNKILKFDWLSPAQFEH